MPVTNPLKDFVITGIKDLRFWDSNGDMIAEISKLTDISLNDETAQSELRGGLGNPVLLKNLRRNVEISTINLSPLT